MHKERLLRLAKRLMRVKPEHFNLKSWATRTNCGMVVCAAGHACMIKEFQKDGLKLLWSGNQGYPSYNDATGFYTWDSIRKFFDLTCGSVKYIFSDKEYPNGLKTDAKTVAKIIRDYVESGRLW